MGKGNLVEGIDGLLPINCLSGRHEVIDKVGKTSAEEGGKKVIVAMDIDDLGIDPGNLDSCLPTEALEGPEKRLRCVVQEDVPAFEKGIVKVVDDGLGKESIYFINRRGIGNGLLQRLKFSAKLLGIAGKESLQKRILVREVVVEGILADKSPVGNVLYGDIIEALLGKKGLQGIHQVPTASLDADILDIGIDAHFLILLKHRCKYYHRGNLLYKCLISMLLSFYNRKSNVPPSKPQRPSLFFHPIDNSLTQLKDIEIQICLLGSECILFLILLTRNKYGYEFCID